MWSLGVPGDTAGEGGGGQVLAALGQVGPISGAFGSQHLLAGEWGRFWCCGAAGGVGVRFRVWGSRRVPALAQLPKSTFPTKTPAWHFPASSCPMLLCHTMGSH